MLGAIVHLVFNLSLATHWLDPLFVEAWGKVLADPELDGSLKGLALALPAEVELAQAMEVIDVDAIHEVRREGCARHTT